MQSGRNAPPARPGQAHAVVVGLVWLGLGDRAIGQVFEVSEEKVLLGWNVGGASNDRECLAHHSVFGQSLHVCFFKLPKRFTRKARWRKMTSDVGN